MTKTPPGQGGAFFLEFVRELRSSAYKAEPTLL